MRRHVTNVVVLQERASGAVAGERNFHVLYQLLAGADVSLLSEWTAYSVQCTGWSVQCTVYGE